MLEGLQNIIGTQDPSLGGNINHGDPFAFAPPVWDYLMDRFAVASILDVGSGQGHCAAYCARKGRYVIAIDGLEANMASAVHPTVLHDLRKGPFVARVDLVHCQELVEHIEESHIDSVIATLANGKIVAMTHALPDQPGHHHVNCKPDEYWIEQLSKAGYSLFADDTERVRAMAKQCGAIYFAASGLVFGRLGI
jgi:SAM-dependent methyltransferase